MSDVTSYLHDIRHNHPLTNGEREALMETIKIMEARDSSVLHDWVMCLPRREQGTLLVATRGCDTAPKGDWSKQLTAAIRFAVLVPADPREVDIPGSFWRREPPPLDEIKISKFDHLPFHFVMHLIQATEVLGYRHPDDRAGLLWEQIYKKLVDGMHLRPELIKTMIDRLSQDRIAAGTVVS